MHTLNEQQQELAMKLVTLLHDYENTNPRQEIMGVGEQELQEMVDLERLEVALMVASHFAIWFIVRELEIMGSHPAIPPDEFDKLAQAISNDFKKQTIVDYEYYIKFREKMKNQKDEH